MQQGTSLHTASKGWDEQLVSCLYNFDDMSQSPVLLSSPCDSDRHTRTPVHFHWAHAHARPGGKGREGDAIYLESCRAVARMPHLASPSGATVPRHHRRPPHAVPGAVSDARAG